MIDEQAQAMETESLIGDKTRAQTIREAGISRRERVPAEEELIREYIVSRDPRLFERIISAHLAWLRRLLYVVFNGGREDMEDAEQDILLKLLSDIRRFRFQSGFKTFFYRYARNKAIDLLRKNVRRKKKETSVAASVRAEERPLQCSPEEEYLRKEKEADVLQGLSRLEPEERLVLLMKDVEEFSLKEISALTGLKTGTVKSRLHRTREKLFGLITQGGEG